MPSPSRPIVLIAARDATGDATGDAAGDAGEGAADDASRHIVSEMGQPGQ